MDLLFENGDSAVQRSVVNAKPQVERKGCMCWSCTEEN